MVLDRSAALPSFTAVTLGAVRVPFSVLPSFPFVRAGAMPLGVLWCVLLAGAGACGSGSVPAHDDPLDRAHLFLQVVDANGESLGWSAVHVDPATGAVGSARAIPELVDDLPHWSLDSGRFVVGSQPLERGRHRFHLYRMGADSTPEPWGSIDFEYPPSLQWMSLAPTLVVGPVSGDLYASNLDGMLRVLDGDSLDVLRTYPASPRTVWLEIDPDEAWMVRGTDTDSEIRWTLYSVATGEPTPAVFDGVPIVLTGPEWMAPGTLRFATDTAVEIRHAPDFEPVSVALPPGRGEIASVRFSSTERLSWTRRDGATDCEVWIGRFTSGGIVADTKVEAPTCSAGDWSPRGDVLVFDGPSGLAWADPENGRVTALGTEQRRYGFARWLWPNVLFVGSCDGTPIGGSERCRTELWAPFEFEDDVLRAEITAVLPPSGSSFVHEP